MFNWLIVVIASAAVGLALWIWMRFRARTDFYLNDRRNTRLNVDGKAITLSTAQSMYHLELQPHSIDFDSAVVREFFQNYTSHLHAKMSAEELERIRHELASKSLVEIVKLFKKLNRRPHPKPIGSTASKFWDILGFLFSRRMREHVYDPVIEELKEDMLLARARRRSPAARRWLQVCFFVRTSVVFLDCVRIALSRPLGRLLPVTLKAWWRLLR
jgi:hypothetical protein